MSANGSTTAHFSGVDLNAYFDGSVPGARAVEMERHLASCPACRSHVASMSGARRAVRLLPTPSVPDIVWRNVARRVRFAHRGSALPSNGGAHPDPSARSTNGNRTGAFECAGFENDAGRSVSPRPAGRRDALRIRSATGKREAYGWKMAAAVGIAIAFVVVLIASPLGGRIAEAVQPPAIGIDYGMYVGGLTDGAAMERFETTYDRRLLAYPTEMADRLVGRAFLDGPVNGLVVRATYSLSDNGVRAVQRTYMGDDVRIDVFRQPADHPVLLDGLRPYQVRLAGVSCIAADTEQYRLVTFIRGQERFVVVLNRPSLAWIGTESRAPALDALVSGLYHRETL